MRTIRFHRRLALFAGAIVLSLQISPAIAGGHDDHNRPIGTTYTKWITTFPLMEGFTGGGVAGEGAFATPATVADATHATGRDEAVARAWASTAGAIASSITDRAAVAESSRRA